MKKLSKHAIARNQLGRVSTATLGGIKGSVEVFGLYTPTIQLG